MQLMSISGTARHLGYKSRSQLYKLIDDGWLDDHLHINMPSGQRLIDVNGLQEKLQGLCHWRIDSVFLRRKVIELTEDSCDGAVLTKLCTSSDRANDKAQN